MRLVINFCDKCPLAIFNGFVPVSGQGEGTDIMIVGEAPGATEARRGIPFVGTSGKLLRRLLLQQNLTKHCYITNAVKCRPPANRKPRESECSSCKPYLLKEIDMIKPKMIVLLGLTAIQSIYPTEFYVKNKLYTFRREGKVIIASGYHPSYILKNKEESDNYSTFFNNIARIYQSLNPYYTKPMR